MKASNPEHSFFISANAGSGKTKILIDRITALILAGANPDQILAITFTNNAAAEIKSRIIKNIINLIALDDEAKRREVEDLLGTKPQKQHLDRLSDIQQDILLGRANFAIHTIHSFSLELLQQFSFEAGLRPGFEVLSDIKAKKVTSEIASKIYAKTELLDNFTFLTSILSLESITEHLNLIIQKRSNIFYLLFKSGGIENQLNLLKELLNLPDDLPNVFELKKQFLLSDQIHNIFKIIKNLNIEQISKTDLEKVNLVQSLNLEDELCVIQSFSKLGDFFCTQKGTKRAKFFSKKIMDSYQEFVQIDKIADQYLELKLLFARIDAYNINKALIEIAVIFLDEYQGYKKELNLVDFEDILIKTLIILSDENANINYTLTKYKHILVDEAQDTSKLQWEIIHYLYEDYFAGGADKTIFVVGDEKQSIYGFQGAKHELFKAKYEELAEAFANRNISFNKIDLVKSYRTSHGLINIINLFCQNPVVQNSLTQFDIKLDHFAHRQSEFMFKLLPFVELKRAKPEEFKLEFPESPIKNISNFILQTDLIINEIKRLTSDSTILASTNANVCYKDFLILLPRRSQFFYDLYQALTDAGIIATVDGIKAVDNDIIFLDLKALIRFSYMPNDDYNLACILKSPLINFSDKQLEQLTKLRDDNDAFSCYFSIIQSDIFPWAQTAKLFLLNILNKSKFLAPADFCLNIAYEYNLFSTYEQEFAGDSRLRLGHILTLIQEFEECYGKSYHEIYVALLKHEKTIKNNISDNSVRLMTIHGSKGLEAPIVILADSNSKVTKNKGQLYFTDDNLLFTAGSSGFAEKTEILDEHNQRLEHEFQRLNYVALTRARDVLIIAGHGNSLINNSLYDLLAQELAKKHDVLIEDILRDGFFQKDLKSENLSEIVNTDAMIENEDFVKLAKVNTDNYQTLLGTLIHNILENLPFIKNDQRDEYISNELNQNDHFIKVEDIELFRQNLTAIIKSSEFAYIFSDNAKSEIEIVHNKNLYRIDKLVEFDDYIEIIDFKTDLNLPVNSDEVMPQYKEQLAIYEDALKIKYQDKKILKKLFYLRHKQIITI